MKKIGQVEALFRYPIKSMAGESLEVAELGWHGLVGDRRLALRRVNDQAGFPFLTASKLPELILYRPVRSPTGSSPASAASLPTHVRTPEGEELEIFGRPLSEQLSQRHGSAVEMMHLDRGIFDEASLSMIATATVEEVARLAQQEADVRRFRPNLLIASTGCRPFEEDDWVGGLLTIGDAASGVAIGVTNRDERCSMINFDPDTARSHPDLLKAVVRERENKAGVYGSVLRRGRIAVGQPVFFEATSTSS